MTTPAPEQCQVPEIVLSDAEWDALFADARATIEAVEQGEDAANDNA